MAWGGGITLEQKRRLITVYERNGGCVSDAMRQVGIGSRKTAYLWLRRYRDGGAPALQPRSHARHTPSTTPDALAAEVVRMRREHAEWGRRRIAQELRRRFGRDVVSPSGVEAALKRAGMWVRGTARPALERGSLPAPRSGAPPALEAIVNAVRQGLAASQEDRARDAVRLLVAGLWMPLRHDETVASRWLRDPRIGSLLLRGLVQFGHSLMNVGEWLRAGQVLTYTAARLSALQDEGRGRDKEERLLGLSVWRDDLWLEAHQYLGIVSREQASADARRHLEAALYAMDAPGRARREASQADSARSNVERDLAVLLRHRMTRGGRQVTLGEIAAHLRRSNECLRAPQSPAMRAAWLMENARLAGFEAAHADARLRQDRNRARDAMGQYIDAALTEVAREDSPILNTKIAIDAADLRLQHGIPLAVERVSAAAAACLRYGYGHEARRILALAGCEAIIGEVLVSDLRRLATRSRA